MFWKAQKAVIENESKKECVIQNNKVFEDFFNNLLKRDMDVTKKVDLKEGGFLGELINRMMNKIHTSIKGIISHMVEVSSAAFNLGSSVDLLKKSVYEQADKIDDISKSTKRLSQDILDISSKTKVLTNQSLKAIDSTVKGHTGMEEFAVDLKNVGVEINDTQNLMESFKDSTKSIHLLTEIIDDITSKLDILSINASIEAARAGQAGSGFAVLAKEIRNLSSKSGSTVSQVNTIVDTIIKDMTDVDDSLTRAGVSVTECLNKSVSIQDDFKNIRNTNFDLNNEVQNISILLQSQESGSLEIRKAADLLKEHTEPVISLVSDAEGMSKQLHSTVDQVLETASFRLDWHLRGIGALNDMKDRISQIDGSNLEKFLNTKFKTLPFVELFYVMTIDGIQSTPNIVNPKYKSNISIEGCGEDRSLKEYVSSLVDDSSEGYVSGIYISSASRDLCVTVSIMVRDLYDKKMILAADMNIKDFIKL